MAPAAQQVVSTVRPMPLAAMPPATGQVPPSEQTLDVDSLPGESDGPLPSGELPQTAGEALRLSTSATRPDMARPLAQQIAQQIAQAAGRAAQAPTEVRLDPEELGRVTLRLSTEDGGVTLHVTAERAETSDLMRRHISLLEESYRSLGYDRIEIAINGRQAGGHPGQGGHGNGQETPAGTGGAPLTQPAPETSTAAPAASPGSSDRIDIRL
ncbi:flagellar hook-length control protein FliK [Pseudooceanicola marinus]|uniref:flagellar hook-length control protein FliK n=1 Tax=Pseudooceanicola marinus TaxID=396013 RepID=UPI0012FD30B4|nr:flagellar hook-length control protein FliK [Pseudooceanicola marinus]